MEAGGLIAVDTDRNTPKLGHTKRKRQPNRAVSECGEHSSAFNPMLLPLLKTRA